MTIRSTPARLFLGLLIATLAASAAHADADSSSHEADEVTPTSGWSVGARVGGYGFRRNTSSEGDERNSWDLCRMNGIGVFVQRALGHGFFLETGFDLYFSESWPFQPTTTDAPLDRTSGLSISGIGYRTQIVPRIAAYAQLGAGVELTHVAIPYDTTTIDAVRVLPVGFVGFGGDIRIANGTYLGMNLRLDAMGNFNYDAATLKMQPGWTMPPSSSQVFDATLGFAAQMQFYLRRDL